MKAKRTKTDKIGQKPCTILAPSPNFHTKIMAKISLSLDTRKKAPVVKLLLSADGKSSLLTLGISLDNQDQWSPSNPRGPVVNHPAARSINALIKSRLAAASDVLHSMMLSGEHVTLALLRERILARIDPDREPAPTDTLVGWLHKYEQSVHGRTRELYLTTERRVFEYAANVTTGADLRDPVSVHEHPAAYAKADAYLERLAVADVTPKWLTDWDTFMSRTMTVNSRAIHLRNIRAVIKYAIRNGSPASDPFVKFSIKREDTRHRALTPEQFREIFTYDIPQKEKELAEYRDIALLVFLLIGINIADLFEASELMNGRLEYIRRKTSRQYSIKVEPEALAIIQRYKGKRHLLRYADTNISHISLTKKLDKALKRIGPVEYVPSNTRNHQPFKRWHGLYPDISVYWLRHTWATFAARIGIPFDTIAKCLGHGKKTVTDIYIDYDQQLIDDANRRVIDYALTLINEKRG